MLKVGLSPSKKVVFVCLDESPLNVMKNMFYFALKALLFFEIFTFFYWSFGCVEKMMMIRKLGLIPTFMTSQTGQQIITIHLLSKISKCKSNYAMKLGQSVEYSMRNIFLEKSSAKCDVEASCRPLYLTNQTCSYLWINSLKSYKVCFYCIFKSKSTKIY